MILSVIIVEGETLELGQFFLPVYRGRRVHHRVLKKLLGLHFSDWGVKFVRKKAVLVDVLCVFLVEPLLVVNSVELVLEEGVLVVLRSLAQLQLLLVQRLVDVLILELRRHLVAIAVDTILLEEEIFGVGVDARFLGLV